MWRCLGASAAAFSRFYRVSRCVPAACQQQQDAAEHETVARAPLDHCHAPVTSNSVRRLTNAMRTVVLYHSILRLTLVVIQPLTSLCSAPTYI